jgi:uncharacterized protein (DUF1015 family)
LAKILPFKAIRPVRDKVHLVATRPYYSYKKNVLKAKLEDNPFSFLHIINPEFNSKLKTKPNSLERFKLVSDSYEGFIDEGILIHEDKPSFYVYRQSKGGYEYTGVIAGASVEEYNNDLIKKHEATLTSREAMFTNYLDVVGYNAEPVLLSYPHNPKVSELLSTITKNRPEYEFSTTDKNKHELWVVESEYSDLLSSAFQEIPCLYIADGHHRSASSALLASNRKEKGEVELGNKDFFLAYFIDEQKLNILEFNRLVKGLNGLSKNEFIDKVSPFFDIIKLRKPSKPSKVHEMTVCIEGDWYLFDFKPEVINEAHPVDSLDPEILTKFVLDPILGIQDLKTDNRIEFISGAESIKKIDDQIKKKKFDIGFVLYPVSMDQVKAVADNNMIMPPKSTWVEPKLRSGLTIYNINE